MHNVTAFFPCNSRAVRDACTLDTAEDRIYRNSISRDNGESTTKMNGDVGGEGQVAHILQGKIEAYVPRTL